MRVLITGGAGFIGSNLAGALREAGDDIGVIDDLSTGKPENVDASTWFRKMDILDERLADTVAEFGPDAVVHLAAQASVVVSLKEPERDWEINAEGTRRVAEAAAAAGVRRVVSASSAAVYGDPASLPLDETAQKIPINPYGESKLAAEEMLASELAPAGVDFASFRFSNVYGPRQDWLGEGGVVAIFCGTLAKGEAPTIFGTGDQTRDFIYVGDVADAIIAALNFDGRLESPEHGGPAFNVSTGSAMSVRELAQALIEAAGFAGVAQFASAREGDIEHSVLDPAKARSVFSWDARTSADRGLARTYEWFAAGRG
jgi:UDP-glucose 4-epimerase